MMKAVVAVCLVASCAAQLPGMGMPQIPGMPQLPGMMPGQMGGMPGQMGGMPQLPQPQMPQMPEMPQGMPQLPQIPGMGAMPQMPGMPQGMPQLPQIPGMGAMPQIPGMPQMGTAPHMPEGMNMFMQTGAKTGAATGTKFVGSPLLSMFLLYLFMTWHYPFYPTAPAGASNPYASIFGDYFKELGKGAESIEDAPAEETSTTEETPAATEPE